MTDDIVTRLRTWGRARSGSGDRCEQMHREAADKIERLQAAGDALAEALHGWCNGMDAFTDDAERLRAWQEARRG